MSKSIFRTKSIERILSDVASGFSDSEHSGDPHLKKELGVRDPTLMAYSRSAVRRYIFNNWRSLYSMAVRVLAC